MRVPRRRPAPRNGARRSRAGTTPAAPSAARGPTAPKTRGVRRPAAQPPPPGDGRGRKARPSFTGRAAALAVVVCLLALSLAYPLRLFLQQRSEIDELRTLRQEQQSRVAGLEEQKRRWQDPTYIKAQARERLHFVLPGEKAYVVVDSQGPTQDTGTVRRADPDRQPWFTRLWASVEVAAATGPATKR